MNTTQAPERVQKLAPSSALRKHAGADGIRLFVWKPDCSDYTTVLAQYEWLEQVLPLVGGSYGALTGFARLVSARTTKTPGKSWTNCVLTNTHRLLQARARAHAKAEAELATENNAAWSHLGAVKVSPL